MTKPRKTFPVAELRDQVNKYLATHSFPGSTDAESRVAREAVAGVLELVLCQTNNYRGFRYLSTETMPDGTLRTDYDGSRRQYL